MRAAGALVAVVSCWVGHAGDGQAASLPDGDREEAQFRKFCVRASLQKRGVGRALLGHALRELAEAGVRRVWCNARAEQAGFYARHFGLRVIAGSEFERDGRPYVLVDKALL